MPKGSVPLRARTAQTREPSKANKGRKPAPPNAAALAAELARLDRELARETKAPAPAGARSRSLLPILSVRELADLPKPEHLIAGKLYVGSFAVLFGDSNVGKTFVALSMVLSIATESDWCGFDRVKPGHVVYVAAEDNPAVVYERIAAWCKEWAPHIDPRSIEQLHVVPAPTNLCRDEGAQDLIETIRSRGPVDPVLIVLDPQSEFYEGTENDDAAMRKFVAGVRTLREAFPGTTVLSVHHTTKGSDGRPKTYRGSTVLRAAADTMLELFAKKDGPMVLACDKQRYAPKFKPEAFLLKDHELAPGRIAATIVPAEDFDVPGDEYTAALKTKLDPRLETMLTVLRGAGADGIGLNEWRRRCEDRSVAGFNKRRDVLVKAGSVKFDAANKCYVAVQ